MLVNLSNESASLIFAKSHQCHIISVFLSMFQTSAFYWAVNMGLDLI